VGDGQRLQHHQVPRPDRHPRADPRPRLRVDPVDGRAENLGLATRGVHQAGFTFPFQTPAAGQTYTLRGAITFAWKLGRKLIGSALVHTKHGYKNVAFSDPPGYSAGTCSIAGPPATPAPVGPPTTASARVGARVRP
jgi:hypothetical protein